MFVHQMGDRGRTIRRKFELETLHCSQTMHLTVNLTVMTVMHVISLLDIYSFYYLLWIYSHGLAEEIRLLS